MNSYIYSAALNMICATVLKKDYELAGTWPDDAVTLSEQHAVEFMAAAPQGKMMAAGIDGLPAWIDLPPPTDAELLEQAQQRKASLLNQAQSVISIWQTKLLLGRTNEQEKTSLNAWLDYIDDLSAAEFHSVADIKWPTPPAA
ncbi:tail fiber assembly protein [Pantoea eucrina]|uniref:tail fiber assembly protein n=1 Tax=Pantoea eucrina TaxID=472693 RepID=UPI0024B789E2|nr:tail fiber assembly protein [Pantoea eucrina]MDJ0025206.1 tail fiber assembly protein [Pantoea eucrina]